MPIAARCVTKNAPATMAFLNWAFVLRLLLNSFQSNTSTLPFHGAFTENDCHRLVIAVARSAGVDLVAQALAGRYPRSRYRFVTQDKSSRGKRSLLTPSSPHVVAHFIEIGFVLRLCVFALKLDIPAAPITLTTSAMHWILVLVLIFAVVSAATAATASPTKLPSRLAIAWNQPTNRIGFVQAMTAEPPWTLATAPLEVGPDALLRFARGKLYVVQPDRDRISVVDPGPWTITRTYTLPSGLEPEDIAVTDSDTAYVSGRRATQLLRLNLASGAVANAADLTQFADADGIPDLGAIAIYAGRLFVQIRRANENVPNRFVPPAYLAVVDVASGQLVDVDPLVSGVQAIQLAGTQPKRSMQLLPPRLFLSASGGFFDYGGIEMIDLHACRSLGLVVHESTGFTGADVGPFVMVAPDRGWLAYTTDLTVSSHLSEFTLAGGPSERAFFTAVDFLAPTLVFQPVANRVFFPNGNRQPGILVFDSVTRQQLTPNPVPTGGPPSDLALLEDAPSFAQPASLSVALHAGLQINGTTGATYRIEFALNPDATNWTTLTNITLPASPYFWADPDAVTNHPRRYYRAVSVE